MQQHTSSGCPTIPIYYCGKLVGEFDTKAGELIWTSWPIEPSPAPVEPIDLVALLHRIADEKADWRKCYFIGGESGPVKIGYSCNTKDRLRTMQFSSPIKLDILATATGGRERESAYHEQFRECRLHGEWFERTPEILAEIERLQ